MLKAQIKQTDQKLVFYSLKLARTFTRTSPSERPLFNGKRKKFMWLYSWDSVLYV